MFERFTERARQVIVLAKEEAQLLRHDEIDVEHILLGLIIEEEGLAAKVLRELAPSLENVIYDSIPKGRDKERSEKDIPFTPEGKKVFETALREALSLGHNYVGTEHILLAVVDCKRIEDILAKTTGHPFLAEMIRNEVIRFLRSPREQVTKPTEKLPLKELVLQDTFDDLMLGFKQWKNNKMSRGTWDDEDEGFLRWIEASDAGAYL